MRPSVSPLFSLLVLSFVTAAVYAQGKFHDIDKSTAWINGSPNSRLLTPIDTRRRATKCLLSQFTARNDSRGPDVSHYTLTLIAGSVVVVTRAMYR